MSRGWTHASVARQRREVARMLERETLTTREISEALGCPFSTAQSRLQELRRAGRVGLYQNAGVSMWFAVDRSPKPTPAPRYDFTLVLPENL